MWKYNTLKPSSLTPLCAIAVQNICNEVTSKRISNIFSLVIGRGSKIGESLIRDVNIPLVSFTGSTRMGKHVSEVVSKDLEKSILELRVTIVLLLMRRLI